MIALGIIVLILIAGIGYYYFHSTPKEQSFDMSKANSFFAQKNTTRAAIISFCNENRKECFYYCENVNKSNGFCRVLGLGDYRANVSAVNLTK